MKRLSPSPTLSDFVKQVPGIVDSWLHQVTLRFGVIRQPTTPGTQEIPNNQWGIFKNTTTGDLTLSLNDDGIVKSTLLTTGGGGGDVLGPAAAIDNHVAFFDGATGKRVKDSGLTLSGTNTGDQTITLTGDVTGSGTGSFTATLKNTGTAGTYVVVTTDAQGRVTSGLTSQDWSSLINTPTTISGYGITDAQPLNADLTAIAALAGSSGLLKKTGLNTWTLDTSIYLTGNETITFSGDISGSGKTSITLTLPVVNANVGTFNNVTVNAKGQVTAASNVAYLEI